MIDEIARAIKDRIDSSAGATLRGYISTRYYYLQSPQGTTFPFLVFSCIADVNDNTFTEENDDTHWQIDVLDDNLDPMASGHLRDITRALRALFDFATLTIGDTKIRIVQRTYDSLDTLTYNQMDLLTYAQLDVMNENYKEYENFGTNYIQQRDIPEEDILHRALEYRIWIQKIVG